MISKKIDVFAPIDIQLQIEGWISDTMAELALDVSQLELPVAIVFVSLEHALAALVHVMDRPCIPVIECGEYVIVGPLFALNRAGCPACLVELLQRKVTPANLPGPLTESSVVRVGRPYAGVSPAVLRASCEIVANKIADSIRTERWKRAVHILNARFVQVAREEFLPLSDCTRCQRNLRDTLPDLRADSTGGMASASKTRRHGLRALHGDLLAGCVGKHVGLVDELAFDYQMPMAAASAWSPVRKTRREPTLGRAGRFDTAVSIALVEALERHSGLMGGKQVARHRASFSSLGGRAVHPRAIGLHPDHLYDLDNYPFERFSEDKVIDWVRALDLTHGGPVWVPHCFAFYGGSENALAFETSNGCAVGSTMSEAILHGLFELIERDAFLMWWYRRRTAVPLPLAMFDSREVTSFVRRVELFCDAEVSLFQPETNHDIPVALAVATSDQAGMPATAVAAGVGLTQEDAVMSALHELAGHYIRLISMLRQPETQARARFLLSSPDDLRSMEEHAIVNALPEARYRFDFLFRPAQAPVATLKPAFAERAETPEECLEIAVAHLRDHGFRVLAVDHTVPALAHFGLKAAKVLCPGLVPMTFGHVFRRTDLDRLKCGMSSAEPMNEHPHPFP